MLDPAHAVRAYDKFLPPQGKLKMEDMVLVRSLLKRLAPSSHPDQAPPVIGELMKFLSEGYTVSEYVEQVLVGSFPSPSKNSVNE